MQYNFSVDFTDGAHGTGTINYNSDNTVTFFDVKTDFGPFGSIPRFPGVTYKTGEPGAFASAMGNGNLFVFRRGSETTPHLPVTFDFQQLVVLKTQNHGAFGGEFYVEDHTTQPLYRGIVVNFDHVPDPAPVPLPASMYLMILPLIFMAIRKKIKI